MWHFLGIWNGFNDWVMIILSTAADVLHCTLELRDAEEQCNLAALWRESMQLEEKMANLVNSMTRKHLNTSGESNRHTVTKRDFGKRDAAFLF